MATSSLLVIIGVRADGQKVLLACESMGAKAPRPGAPVLDDLIELGCGGRSSLSLNLIGTTVRMEYKRRFHYAKIRGDERI